MKKRKYYCEVK